MTWYINGVPVSRVEYEAYMKKFEPEAWRKIQENNRRLREKTEANLK